jgi:hypothetical protein
MGAAIYTLFVQLLSFGSAAAHDWGAQRVCEGLGSHQSWFYEKGELGFVKIDPV